MLKPNICNQLLLAKHTDKNSSAFISLSNHDDQYFLKTALLNMQANKTNFDNQLL